MWPEGLAHVCASKCARGRETDSKRINFHSDGGVFCRTSEMSHGRDWRDSWLCTRRDSPGRWLWRLVRLFGLDRLDDRLGMSESETVPALENPNCCSNASDLDVRSRFCFNLSSSRR